MRPVLVLHKRKFRTTLAARLTGETSAETIWVMLSVFARIPRCASLSLSIMTRPSLGMRCCGPCARWPPRQNDIDQVSDAEIQDIVLTADLTPRKCLGFKTPFQAILNELGKDVQIRFSETRCKAPQSLPRQTRARVFRPINRSVTLVFLAQSISAQNICPPFAHADRMPKSSSQ